MRHPPWYFILNWQNTFDFIPDYPHIRTDLKVDITNQALAIKSAALAALRQAYSRWPVVVVEGTPNIGDHQAVVQTTSAGQGDSCGTTNVSGAHPVDSEIWYECNMETAQEALHVTINNAQDESVALTRNDLIQSIGRGIGNNGAHEIAHQLLILCCSMEVLISADPNAAGTYNNGDADGDPNPQTVNSDPSPYTGFWKDGTTAIHWEDSTRAALDKCLMKGWVNFGRACANELHLSKVNFQSKNPPQFLAKELIHREPRNHITKRSIPVLPVLSDTPYGEWLPWTKLDLRLLASFPIFMREHSF